MTTAVPAGRRSSSCAPRLGLQARRHAGLVILGLSLAAGSVLPAAAEDETTVTLPLAQDSIASIANIITVTVGGGNPAPLAFDTGSSGLRIQESMIGPGVRKTDRRITGQYPDGTVVEGYLAYAVIGFPGGSGPATTDREVPVEVITSVRCGAFSASCAGVPVGTVGYFGADYRGQDGLSNPFQALPGNLASGYVIDVTDSSNPFVDVGLTRGNAGDFDFQTIPPGSGATVDGARTWATDALEACYTLDTMGPACQPVLFASGAMGVTFALPGYDPQYFSDPAGNVTPGNTVQMQIGSVISLDLEANGDLRDQDLVVVPRAPTSVAGMPFFQHYAVAFDAREGRIGFQDGD